MKKNHVFILQGYTTEDFKLLEVREKNVTFKNSGKPHSVIVPQPEGHFSLGK